MTTRRMAMPQLADDLAAVFAAELEEQLRAAADILPGLTAAALASSPHPDLARIFHTIKGGAGLAGRSELAAAAASLERSFRNPQTAGPPAPEALDELFAAAGLPSPRLAEPAAVRGLVLAIGAQRFALPLSCVERAAVIEPGAIAAGAAGAVVAIAGRNHPLVPLHAWLGELLPSRRAAGLLLRRDGGPVALPADRIGAPCDLRLTALGPAFADHPLFRHATVDRAGEPLSVLDPARLVALAGADLPERQRPLEASRQAVLVVDDSRTVRNAIAAILSTAGIDFDLAVDGHDALTKLGHASFALVLTDLEMPNMDGVQLLEALRGDARWQAQPVVVCSSRPAEEGGRLGQLGVAGYLAKPFSAAALLERVQPFIGSAIPQAAAAG